MTTVTEYPKFLFIVVKFVFVIIVGKSNFLLLHIVESLIKRSKTEAKLQNAELANERQSSNTVKLVENTVAKRKVF